MSGKKRKQNKKTNQANLGLDFDRNSGIPFFSLVGVVLTILPSYLMNNLWHFRSFCLHNCSQAIKSTKFQKILQVVKKRTLCLIAALEVMSRNKTK